MYRLLRLFLMKKSERTHAAAPPFQIEPAPLGFDLVPVKALDGCFHPAITRLIKASFVSLSLDFLSYFSPIIVQSSDHTGRSFLSVCFYFYPSCRARSCQNATALAAATFSESTPCAMGIRTV